MTETRNNPRMRRLESPRRLFVVWFVVTLLLALTAVLGGCAAAQNHDPGIAAGFVVGAVITLAGAVTFYMWGEWKAVVLLLGTAIILALGGCAALPMPLQPQTENNSNMAEGTFILLAAVDTVQTMHIRQGTSCDHEADPIAAALYGSKYPKPGRVLVTNLALITVHTMLASWLDDKVAEHAALDDGSVGPWYVGRIAFHAVSIVAEGSSVINNHARGCKP